MGIPYAFELSKHLQKFWSVLLVYASNCYFFWLNVSGAVIVVFLDGFVLVHSLKTAWCGFVVHDTDKSGEDE